MANALLYATPIAPIACNGYEPLQISNAFDAAEAIVQPAVNPL